ncbi:MAG: flavin reductase [Defluviitaleaceae bacterium]|nr:flavin reductase [Defluviitaleaceae bacterium]MCL2274520.1 flavin reductase [Defluviitaleaceae bacterium]
MDKSALFKISYGLYALSAAENGADNACIIDAFSQVTSVDPIICVANVNKENRTHDMILNTKRFNLSVLTKDTPFAFFERFGLQSGKNVNKFENYTHLQRAENGLLFFTRHTNAHMAFEVTGTMDFGTHTLFSAQLTDSAVLNNHESVTYEYYREHIKPKAQTEKKGWTCTVCGYFYEGEDLPHDYLCPLCKAAASAFELRLKD